MSSVSLETLQSEVEMCAACSLGVCANHKVFGSGDSSACVMFVGEAPGAQEDKTGLPFAGAAGKRLDALLSLAHLEREDIFIANVLKCRPPKNRDPKREEVKACKHFLEAQVACVNPAVLVGLGNFGTRFLLGDDVNISEVHGTFHKIGARYVYPVFHPAAAIYDPKKQDALEADFIRLGAWLNKLEVQG